jgi:hypothetical protein
MWVAPVTHPGMFLVHTILSVFTCGLFLLYWFPLTLRKPKIDTVTIDEHGNQLWANKGISPAQRVVSVVVGIAILWWLIQIGHFYEAAHQPNHYR